MSEKKPEGLMMKLKQMVGKFSLKEEYKIFKN